MLITEAWKRVTLRSEGSTQFHPLHLAPFSLWEPPLRSAPPLQDPVKLDERRFARDFTRSVGTCGGCPRVVDGRPSGTRQVQQSNE